MPFKSKPICLKCKTEESPLWRNAENLGVLCLDCVTETKDRINAVQAAEDEQQETAPSPKKKARSSVRSKSKLNPFASKAASSKGRRTKGIPVKSPQATATPVTSDSVFHKGTYWQVGDIVSMLDEEGDTYYAQIRGFLTDQYCERSACITWLLPTKKSPPPEEAFEPATYIAGPEEELPRKLDCMEFVMHAPSDFFRDKNTPYPPINPPAQPGYIWTHLNPVQRPQPGTSKDS